VDYDERVRRCVTRMQNARTQTMFQGKVLVAPDLLDECIMCMWEYINTPAPTPA